MGLTERFFASARTNTTALDRDCARRAQGKMGKAPTHDCVDTEAYLSTEGRSREMAGLRKLVTAFAGQPGIIGLHGGLPPASSFPIKAMTLTLGDGRIVTIDDPAKVHHSDSTRKGDGALSLLTS